MSAWKPNSTKQHEVINFHNFRNGRKSIATISVTGSEQPNYNNYNSHKPNMTKENVFFGIGNQNFCQTTKM